MGEKEPLNDERVTHSICDECLEKYFGEEVEHGGQ